MRLGYALLKPSEEDGAAQTARLLKAGCDRVYLERIARRPRMCGMSPVHQQRQPRLARLLGSLKAQDVLVVDDLTRLTHTAGKACAALASLRILEAGFVSLADGIDTVQGPSNQVFEVFAAFERFPRSGAARRKALDEHEIQAARAMLASQAMPLTAVAAELDVTTGMLLDSLGPKAFAAQLLIPGCS